MAIPVIGAMVACGASATPSRAEPSRESRLLAARMRRRVEAVVLVAGDVARETGGQRTVALAIKGGVPGGEADDGVQITALLVQQFLAAQLLGGEQCGEPGVALGALAAMQPVLQRTVS